MGDKAAKVEETEPTLESSSLETPKISVEGEEKKDCDETSSAHPLDDVQENPALVHLFTDAALLERSRLTTIRFSTQLIYRVGWSQVGPQRQQGLASATWD